MEAGSIVIMDKPMDEALWQAMATYMVKPPPRPSDSIYMVSNIAPEEEVKELDLKEGIYLIEYPEYETNRVPFDSSLFVELLRPEPIALSVEAQEPMVTVIS